MKLGFKIVDHLIMPSLVNEFTWTGVSRLKTGNKEAFNQFKNVIATIDKVLKCADNRHTYEKTELFLKEKILKHSKQRCARKR